MSKQNQNIITQAIKCDQFNCLLRYWWSYGHSRSLAWEEQVRSSLLAHAYTEERHTLGAESQWYPGRSQILLLRTYNMINMIILQDTNGFMDIADLLW